jgi:hypothetical protein
MNFQNLLWHRRRRHTKGECFDHREDERHVAAARVGLQDVMR